MKHAMFIALLSLATAQVIALENCRQPVENALQEFNKKSKEFEPLLSQENALIAKARIDKRVPDTSRFIQMTSSLNATKLELCARFEDSYTEKDSCLSKDSHDKDTVLDGKELLKDCRELTKLTK